MDELIKIYTRFGSTLPESLKKSIGYCKFPRMTIIGPYVIPDYGPEPKYNGKASGYVMKSGTAMQNDTCLYFKGKLHAELKNLCFN